MTRPVATLVVAIVALTCAAVSMVRGESIDSNFWTPFSSSIGVLAGAAFVYNQWLWYWPGVHALVKKPRLEGTWVGELRSDYRREPDDQALPPIRGVLVVSQTASTVHVRLFTKESRSTTVAASIEIEDGDRFCLSTVYRNEPGLDLQARSPIHYGATRLAIEGTPRNPVRMEGFYWTARQPAKTAGRMDFHLVNRNRAHSFAQALAMVESVDVPGAEERPGHVN